MTLNANQKQHLQDAVNLMTKGQSYESPFDATVIEQVAKVAASSGFTKTDGVFLQQARDNPFSTLLRFILFVGA